MSATEFTKERLQSEDYRARRASQIKLAAIAARVDGEHDHPALMHFGLMQDLRSDITRIIRSDLTPDEVERLHQEWDVFSEVEN